VAPRAPRALLIVLLAGVLLAACASNSSTTTSSAPAVQHVGARDAAGTLWLCRPGEPHNPCVGSASTTVVPAHGPRTIQTFFSFSQSRFDCFYLYPTVSTEDRDSARLRTHLAEIAAARSQAAPFSRTCRVWAPIYRQRTEHSLLRGLGRDPKGDLRAYASVLSAWKDYLTHYNDGRPVIFIGHSQGAAVLIRLLQSQIDENPTLRARMVSAILAGGNVTVPLGKTEGATFDNLPLCTHDAQVGCVIAYSSFPHQPSAHSPFGRPGIGVSRMSGQSTTEGLQVACVNPANLAGGVAPLTPLFLTRLTPVPAPPVRTTWVTFANLYRAQCESAQGATWLNVTLTPSDPDRRPELPRHPDPGWGYHVQDINLAAGDLVNDVEAQEQAYLAAHS
jgi:pimeloyl-ACP methyl ester carboxylesterase